MQEFEITEQLRLEGALRHHLAYLLSQLPGWLLSISKEGASPTALAKIFCDLMYLGIGTGEEQLQVGEGECLCRKYTEAWYI